MFSVKAQDLKTSDINSININNWMHVPHITGRYATLDEFENNIAVYGNDNYKQEYIPIDLKIPFLALLPDPITEIKDTVVVIQAHKINEGIITGFKLFHGGGQGTSLLKDLILIDETTNNNKEVKNVINTNFNCQNDTDEQKISVVIPNCGIDSRWHRLKHSLNDEYWAFYEQINNRHGGNFLIKKYNSKRSTIPDFLVKGLNLKDSLFTNGKWIGRMLYLGESIRFSLPNIQDEENGRYYSIYAKGNLVEMDKNDFPYFKQIENYELIADSHKDKVKQTIKKMNIFSWPSGGFEGGVYIHWIGDLNEDNQLDMLVGISEHYAGSALSLFLSDNSTKELFKEYNVGACSND